MARCPCMDELEGTLAFQHGGATFWTPILEAKIRAPLKRPVKVHKYRKDSEMRLHTWKRIYFKIAFCPLCGKPWPRE